MCDIGTDGLIHNMPAIADRAEQLSYFFGVRLTHVSHPIIHKLARLRTPSD